MAYVYDELCCGSGGYCYNSVWVRWADFTHAPNGYCNASNNVESLNGDWMVSGRYLWDANGRFQTVHLGSVIYAANRAPVSRIACEIPNEYLGWSYAGSTVHSEIDYRPNLSGEVAVYSKTYRNVGGPYSTHKFTIPSGDESQHVFISGEWALAPLEIRGTDMSTQPPDYCWVKYSGCMPWGSPYDALDSMQRPWQEPDWSPPIRVSFLYPDLSITGGEIPVLLPTDWEQTYCRPRWKYQWIGTGMSPNVTVALYPILAGSTYEDYSLEGSIDGELYQNWHFRKALIDGMHVVVTQYYQNVAFNMLRIKAMFLPITSYPFLAGDTYQLTAFSDSQYAISRIPWYLGNTAVIEVMPDYEFAGYP